MNVPKEIILHCAATPEGKNYTVEEIDAMHKQRGFNKIGYHYVIYLDGTINQGRNENEVGAHCLNHNATSIGICYIGGCDKTGKTAKDTRTVSQKMSLLSLVDDLIKKYNLSIDNVHGHYEFANKACPSFKIEGFRKDYQSWKKSPITYTLLLTLTNTNWLEKIFKFIYKIIKNFNKK